jgi:protease I
MSLEGKRVAILVEKLYEDMELWYPYYRMREAGAEVFLVGPKAGETYPSKHGYPAKSERAAGDVSATDVDAVIIPGGYSPDHMRRDRAMVALVRDAHAQGRVVAAICHAGWMLVSAGIARGRRLTGFHSIRDDLLAAGADYVDQPVVRDGTLITSRQPDDLPHFCREIVAALSRVEEREPVGVR